MGLIPFLSPISIVYRMFEVLLVGQIDDPTFQRAITAAEWAKNQSHIKMELVQLYQIEWKSWIEQNRQKYNAWNDEMNYLVVINGDSDEEYQMFWSFCDEKFCYEEGEIDYEKQATSARLNKIKNLGTISAIFLFRTMTK